MNEQETIERSTFEQLKQRYDELLIYAQGQNFVTVYRAEGGHNLNSGRTTSDQLKGAWYTPRFDVAQTHKLEIEHQIGTPVRIFALIVPESLLHEAGPTQTGLNNELWVLNKELQEGRQEITNPSEATAPSVENYLSQFAFVRYYKQLKQKYG